MRFILAVVNGELEIRSRRRADVEAELQAQGYDRLAPLARKKALLVRPGGEGAGGGAEMQAHRGGRGRGAPQGRALVLLRSRTGDCSSYPCRAGLRRPPPAVPPPHIQRHASPARAQGSPPTADGEEGEGEDASAASSGGSYDYLLGMALSSLTREKVEALRSEADETQARVEALRGTGEGEMWRADLEAFLEASSGGVAWGCGSCGGGSTDLQAFP